MSNSGVARVHIRSDADLISVELKLAVHTRVISARVIFFWFIEPTGLDRQNKKMANVWAVIS